MPKRDCGSVTGEGGCDGENPEEGSGKVSVRRSTVLQGVMGWKLLWISPLKACGRNNRDHQKDQVLFQLQTKLHFVPFVPFVSLSAERIDLEILCCVRDK